MKLEESDLDAIARAVADRLIKQSPAIGELVALSKCGVPVRTLRSAIKSGKLPASKLGRDYYVRRCDLEAWVAAERVKAAKSEEPRERELSPAERALDRARRAGKLRRVG